MVLLNGKQARTSTNLLVGVNFITKTGGALQTSGKSLEV